MALVSVGGAPDAEFALFDPGEIELAATGPGMVQEVGYATTVADAVGRLDALGLTWELALEASAAMQPTLSLAYARGSAVRRVAMALGPTELFDGFRYDAVAKQYEGRWLDLPGLAAESRLPRLTATLQALNLRALLQDEPRDDRVRLATRDVMAGSRPGGRSFRRASFPALDALTTSLRAFAGELRGTPRQGRTERDAGPSVSEVLDVIRDRIALTADPARTDRLRALEQSVGIRQRPMRGPLADPELWALDEQLSAGRPEGVVELIEALERTRGKHPGTAYLRLRTALILGSEPPRAIAERVASLALTLPAFVELELLAMEAWNAAGDPKRALPFTRDLIANVGVNDELRVRESQQIAAVRPPAPVEISSPAALTSRPSLLGMSQARIAPHRPVTTPAAGTHGPTIDLLLDAEPPNVAAAASGKARSQVPTTPPTSPRGRTRPILDLDEPEKDVGARPTLASPVAERSSLTPDSMSRRATPPMIFGAGGPERPSVAPVPVPTTRSPTGPGGRRPISGTWVGPAPAPATAPTVAAPRGATASEAPAARVSTRPAGPTALAEDGRRSGRPSAEMPRVASRAASELMRGASQPPFRSDSPEAHVHVPRASAPPHFNEEAEAASALSLPEGLSGVPAPVDELPRTVLDARVQFTFLARELGREYEERFGILLRADVSGVEEMQRVLLERYQDRTVTTSEAAADVRRHGAFLSEILARAFGAFWVDIGPRDVGYWAMVLPPATRVWPFGRVLRLIAMQHHERDLVSYFLELQSRTVRP